MPKIKDVLTHVSVETAERKRKCHRAQGKHGIAAGESCLVVHGGAYNAGRNYCSVCAKPILDDAEAKLKGLRKSLGV